MLVNFMPTYKHYASDALNMPNITLEISDVNQLIECIRDGYAPLIEWKDTRLFMYEMIYKVADKKPRCMQGVYYSVIDTLSRYYHDIADFCEWHAIMTFKLFIETNILDIDTIMSLY